ncbi:acyl-CoA dehydrogenase family protein [uncultured Pseudacidovorax sp.]|uniref:acyl-CoA dehydrogenase family protein n=1 Tax=uncultured Pseudacidovorax sp. TaxID=679313 RepID=UPI0025E87029|nr:acyl-CoA dehydrogenase family protein [uncultured Pseudacidovorax sp.]
MELFENAFERAFRAEIRHFLAAELPGSLKKKVMEFQRLERADFVLWHNTLADHGFAGPAWPKEYGGPGWNAMQRKIFDEECFLAGAPRLIPHVNMICPVLQRYGSEAQKERFLSRIWRLKDWWCQGYSEPGAGSDLASLQTRAERRGDVYVVNGQKTWTTWAHWADWMFCLVRTDSGKPQASISFLLIDMKAPGVTVRPIISTDGVHDLNDVFLDDVEVPVSMRVGEENHGWTIAKYLLTHERTDLAGVGLCKRFLHFAKQVLAPRMEAPEPADLRLRDRLRELELDVKAHEWTVLRVISADDHGESAGAAASILKIRSTELQQAITALMLDCGGPQSLRHLRQAREVAWESGPGAVLPVSAMQHALAAHYLDWRKVTIFGGTTEVQKNIISKTVLGL